MSVTSARKAMRESFADRSDGAIVSAPNNRFTYRGLELILEAHGWRRNFGQGAGAHTCTHNHGGLLTVTNRLPGAFCVHWDSQQAGKRVGFFWIRSPDELEAFAIRVDRLAERADALALRREKVRKFREAAFKAQFAKLADPKWRWRAKWRRSDVLVEVFMSTLGRGRYLAAKIRCPISDSEARENAPWKAANGLAFQLCGNEFDISAEVYFYRTGKPQDPGPGWEGGP